MHTQRAWVRFSTPSTRGDTEVTTTRKANATQWTLLGIRTATRMKMKVIGSILRRRRSAMKVLYTTAVLDTVGVVKTTTTTAVGGGWRLKIGNHP